MSKTSFSIILDADNKQISTESLVRIAAAPNIYVSGDCNLSFKVCSAIGKHAEALSSADTDIRSPASIANFFKSFESRRRLIFWLLMHCIAFKSP
jgi:hypothetical protein